MPFILNYTCNSSQPSQGVYCLMYVLKCLLFLLSFLWLARKKFYVYTYVHTHTHMTKPSARHLQHFAQWSKTGGKTDSEISGSEM